MTSLCNSVTCVIAARNMYDVNNSKNMRDRDRESRQRGGECATETKKQWNCSTIHFPLHKSSRYFAKIPDRERLHNSCRLFAGYGSDCPNFGRP
jgi:hypothetical protein